MKLLGYSEEITVCDCCGKSNLACTVGIEMEDGSIVYYGRTCAALALMGRKSAKNADIILSQAKALTKVHPIVAQMREIIDGRDPAWGARAIRHGKELGRLTMINGCNVLVCAYPEAQKICVYWNGGYTEISLTV